MDAAARRLDPGCVWGGKETVSSPPKLVSRSVSPIVSGSAPGKCESFLVEVKAWCLLAKHSLWLEGATGAALNNKMKFSEKGATDISTRHT